MSVNQISEGAFSDAAPVYLFVGQKDMLLASAHRLPAMREIHCAAFADIQQKLLQIIAPDVIVSPLFASSFDASDLAARLNDLGFLGQYRALTRFLPKPEVILREVRSVGNNVNFDLLFTMPDQK